MLATFSASASPSLLKAQTNNSEDVLSFLGKEKNKKALDYLKKGYKATEAAKLAGVHINTITKIKKLGLSVNLVS